MKIAPGLFGMRVDELRRNLACQPDDYVIVVPSGPDATGLEVMREDGLTPDAYISFVSETTTSYDRASCAQQVDEGGESG